MKILDYLRYPASPRQLGLYFVFGGTAFILLSFASPANDRDDWLDPRWWVRACGAFVIVVGILFVIWPRRGGFR